MTAAQRRWLDLDGPRYLLGLERSGHAAAIPPQPPLDLRRVFGRGGDLIVEIGCGHGEALAAAAVGHPDVNYIGFEVFEAGLAAAVGALAAVESDNVRLVAGDGVEGLRHLLGPSSCAEIWVFFPDPWPKARHRKRRLVSPAFARLAASRLRVGGRLRLATDWPDYALAMAAVLDADPAYIRRPGGRGERPVTKYEARGLAQGNIVCELVYERLPPAAGPKAAAPANPASPAEPVRAPIPPPSKAAARRSAESIAGLAVSGQLEGRRSPDSSEQRQGEPR
jgi:tRNA (guanine-N7-)-methyltransferase